MFEVSESHLKAVNNEVEDFASGRWAGVVRECVQGALNTRLIERDTQIVSLYHRCACLPAPLCATHLHRWPADLCHRVHRQCLQPSDLDHEAFSSALGSSHAQVTLFTYVCTPVIRDSGMQAAGARLPHAQPGAGWRAGEVAAVAEGVRHLVARPLRQLQVRGRQPGPLAHAGRRGG